MSTNGNGHEESGVADERIDVSTADLSDPAILRRYLIERSEAAQATLETVTRMAVSLEQHRAESVRQHHELWAKLDHTSDVCDAMGPQIAALRDDRNKDVEEIATMSGAVQRIAETVHDAARLMERFGVDFSSRLYLSEEARVESSRVTQAEMERLQARLVETREAVNKLGKDRDDVADLGDVTAIRSIETIVAHHMTRAERDAAVGKLTAVEAATEKRRAMVRDVAKGVVLLCVGALITYVLTRLGLK